MFLGITHLNSKLQLPPDIYHQNAQQQLSYVHLATQAVEEFTPLRFVVLYLRQMTKCTIMPATANVFPVAGGLCFRTSKHQAEQSTVLKH